MMKPELRISNQLMLLNIPEEFKNWFIDQLTFENPLYKEAEKHGRYTRRIPKELKLYRSLPNGIVVPRGYLQIVEDAIMGQGYGVTIKDDRILLPPVSVKSNIELRPYQSDAKYLLLSHPNGMLIAPAASGKTIMGLDIFASLHQKMLWLTHTNRLAKQVVERILETFEDIDPKEIGIIGGGKFKIGERITIGMIPTLVRKETDLPIIGRSFGLVIMDECLVADSKVLLSDGSIKAIKDVANEEVTPFGKVTDKFSRTTQQVVKLGGGFGQLAGTSTHRLPYIPYNTLVKDKRTNYYRRLSEKDVIFGNMGDIQPNDFLLVTENFCHTTKYNIGREKSRLLALIACDGHVEKHLYCVQIGITKDKEWFLNEMISNTSFVKDPDIRTSNCVRGDLIIRCYSKEVISYLNKYIPKGNKSRCVKVPEIMEYASIEDITNFLQVVFDTEGSVTDQITLTMSSHSFVRDVSYLLRKFGIVARIIPIKRKNMLRLSMSGYDAFLFRKKIGFSIHRKQALLENMMSKTAKWRRMVRYKNILYRCMPIVHKEFCNESTEVYDFTTQEHLFIVNGVLSSNCHHAPASTFLKILSYFSSFYMYGLTATPYRRDELEDMMFASIGLGNSIIERKEVQKQGKIITPIVYVRHVPSIVVDGNDYAEILREVLPNNNGRTNLITADVVGEAKAGNFCIVICMRKAYAELMLEEISKQWDKTGIATGDHSRKHNDEQVLRLERNEITVLITTFDLLGEGFDVPKLNRGFIVTPFREKSRVEQAVGRIQRTCPGKIDSILYDYVDINIGILKNQFINRALTYRKLGMKILTK